MGLRVATIDDLEVCMKLAMKFAAASPYIQYVNNDKIEMIISNLLTAPNTEKIIILYDDVAMLAAIKSEYSFGLDSVATEIAWFVDEEHRKSNIGRELVEAFEYWAQEIGCVATIMSCLDESISKFYDKIGYKLYEQAFFKEIKCPQ